MCILMFSFLCMLRLKVKRKVVEGFWAILTCNLMQ